MMFLTEFHGSDAARLTAAADAVFAALVDIDRLPEWNARVHHVIESPAPASPVAEGAEWVVQMRASGGRWPSRSRALVADPVTRRFEYMPPGHVPAAQAGSEFVMFSPQEELAVSEAALKANMQRLMQNT